MMSVGVAVVVGEKAIAIVDDIETDIEQIYRECRIQYVSMSPLR